ncbi:MAG: Na/Pi cotransporter family protein [Oscillospiraceae bacterium]|nr:Na/Pi cotransporter family protein [Oscillospiraceae bacterium]
MDIFSLFSFAGGLGLFLFGMNVLSEAIARQAGGALKSALEKITSSRLMGALLGLVVTAVIQSSGATTVMLVGFINSGIMSLQNAVGPILGANIGTTVTAWLLALNDISGTSFALQFVNPDSFVPVLAFVGAILLLFFKRDRTRDVGSMLLSFAVLMYGMSNMSDAMSPMKDSTAFQSALIALRNPLLGVAVGALIAAVLQSSSASVGIVQAAAITGVISVSNALPLIMGINIGAGLIVLLSAVGTNRDARRAAWIYILYNCIGALLWIIPLCIIEAVGTAEWLYSSIDAVSIAVLHTAYKTVNTAIMLPFSRQLISLSRCIIRPQPTEQKIEMLDDNILKTPSVAIARCRELTADMAELTRSTLQKAVSVVQKYDDTLAKEVSEMESRTDYYEDNINNYLVKLSAHKLSAADTKEVTKLLHGINNLERITDHAKNVMEAGRELNEKSIHFTAAGTAELSVMCRAVEEITNTAVEAFIREDAVLARQVDPLEQVVDDLCATLRDRHIERLRAGTCSTTLGFIFTDILTDLERISDHCSNIAMSVLQLRSTEYEPHRYEAQYKATDADFNVLYHQYQEKYSI